MASARDLVREVNGLDSPLEYHRERRDAEHISLAELQARRGRVTRVRLLADVWPGRGRVADVSYIHGVTGDGEPVSIIPSGDLMGMPLRAGGVQKHFVQWAKDEGVYAKGLGLLDQGNWSILY